MNSLWTTCLLTLPLVFANELQTPSYIIEKANCLEGRYFYQDAEDARSCFLCFCRNSTATCWRRERIRCGEEIHQIVDLPSGNRLRRSPVSLSDIFFRDATREFFQKQLPQQCTPHEGSFSDGCPPADWCVGCTVCDCDPNGRWDCHVLSFCNGEEKKKKKKIPLPKSMPTRRVYHMKKASPINYMTPKPKKSVKKSIPKRQHAQRKYKNSRRQNNNVKKSNNNNKKPTNNKRPNRNVKRQSMEQQKRKKPVNNNRKIINKQKPKPRPIQRKPQEKAKPRPKPRPKPKPTTRKPHRKRYMVKKAQKKPIITTTKRTTTTAAPKKILRNSITTSTNKPSDEILDEEYITSHLKSETGSESELGRKIVSKMMGTVQRMLGKQMEKLRKSRVERSINETSDCKKKNMKNKKWKLKDMLRKKKLKHRKMPRFNDNSVRMKREALDLDLSVIELNDANLINDSQDFSVKRITKNITNFNVVPKITYLDQNNVNKYDSNSKDSNIVDLITNLSNLHNLTKNYMNPNVSKTYLRGNATNNLTTKITPTNKLSNSTAVNQYYKYSLDKKNSSSATVTTTMVTTMLTTNKSNSTINPLLKNKTTIKNKTGKTATTEFVLIANNPEFNDLKYKKWERMKILRDNIIQVNQISKFNKLNTGLNDYSIDSSLFKRLRNIKNKENRTRQFGVINKNNLKKITYNLKTDSTSYNSTTLKPINFNRNMSSLQVLLRDLMKTLSNSTTTPSKLRTKFSLFKYLRSIFQKIFYRKKGKHFIDHKTNEAMTLQILCENVGACYLNKHNRLTLRNKLHDLNTETEKIFRTIKIIKGLLYLIVLPAIKDNSTAKKPHTDKIQKLDAILRGTYGDDSNLTQTQASQISYVKDNMQQFGESVGKFAAILDEILKVLYKNNKKYSCQRNLRFYSKKKKLNAFNKIKNLLYKYNIVQNTFMKRMYNLLTDVEKNMTTDKPQPKVSDRDMNNTQVIDKYSTNIIQNLRKLKELAQALSSSRRKRQTMRQDDAFQYLLILMEYLLKKNHPLETPPVNDGIDLLIEAIQNAPDIKTIQKKVLDELSTTQRVTRTTSNLRYLNENSNSDSKAMSREGSKNSDEETTPMVYYKRFYENDNSTDFVSTEYSSTKTSDKTKVVTEEKVGFDKFESVIDDRRKYDAFNTELEEEPIPTVVVNTTDVLESTTIQNEQTTYVPSHDFKLDEDPVRLSKTKLVWIEENFDKEIKDYRQEDLFNMTMHTTPSTLKSVPKSVDISSITLEVDEEKKKKTKVADDVMHRKQIEFLNSLDYGTERSEFEDSDLKDDEKFSGDSPSYFVK